MAQSNPKRLDVKLEKWTEAFELAEKLSKVRRAQWFFRGHSDEDWHLKSTLERAAGHYRKNKPGLRRELDGLGDVERRVLIAFHRAARLHGVNIPENDYLDWLAMLQHHGGPTRLLDFTRSFWVGVFFAIQPTVQGWPKQKKDADKTKKDKEGSYNNNAVWAIQSRKLWEKAVKRLDTKQEKFRPGIAADRRSVAWQQCAKKIALRRGWRMRRVDEKKPLLALPLELEQMNERMLAQRGCFIFPLAAGNSFEENLYGTFRMKVPDKHPDPDELPALRDMKSNGDFPLVMRILLPREKKRGYRILEDMNITAATLFPGLAGLALSTYRNVWQ